VKNIVIRKGKFLSVSIAVIGLIVVASLSFRTPSSINAIPIYYAHGGYAIDVNDTREVVGDADYLFVAKVRSQVETIYDDDIVTEDKIYSGTAHTIYEIDVVDNIKNNLIMDAPITIAKLGGIRADHSAYDLPEGDILLDEGKFYIFAAYTQDDGTLTSAGKNSTIAFSEESKQMILNGTLTLTPEYNEYLNAYENQVMTWKESDNIDCIYNAPNE
jgi:hypothetical protein